MRIAIVCSNLFNICEETKKGTEIISYSLIKNLIKVGQKKKMDFTVFASGASTLPMQIESVDHMPSSADKEIMENGKHIIFELALISKAFCMQEEFDLYHINIGDGDIVLPFTPFVEKPILITLHHIYDADYTRKYFSFYKGNKKVYFVSVSDAQRKILPDLNYAATIHHGIDTVDEYTFNLKGGSNMVWAGRLIPQKGPDIVMEVSNRIDKSATLFGISKKEQSQWADEQIIKGLKSGDRYSKVNLILDHDRLFLIPYFQNSRLLLFPVQAEEAFGLVLIESMACGTPVVAFARGAIPEIIEDGVTGFLVNPSSEDIRGNWIIKQVGLDGLCEAVEKIYALSENEYEEMRKACRKRVEERFSVQRMISEYEDLYEKIILSSIRILKVKED